MEEEELFMESQTVIRSDKLAYWYFRLNGFLTIPNFVVHPEWTGRQRTEVDILGVRFPHRAELLQNPMIDDEVFTKIKGKPYIIIAEVKKETCNLNGPWVRREAQNMNRVLKAIGAFKDEIIDEVARKLYEEGVYENELYYVSLFCVGRRENSDLQGKFKKVPQVIWDDILKFIYNRFKRYEGQKHDHRQWDSTGHELWKAFRASKDENEFTNKIRVTADNSG